MKNFSLWTELLEYARWSPSPHNVQPWKLKLLSETKADLYYDPTRLLPDEDPQGRFLLSGFGIFLESLAIAANPTGHTIKITYVTKKLDSSRPTHTLLAHLSLVKTTKKEPLNRELIKQRRTSRLSFDSRHLEQHVITELQSIAKAYGQTFTFSSSPDLIRWVTELNKDTMFYDMNDDKTRNEVGSWVRYTTQEATTKKDGLWSYCMNVPSSLMYLFFHARWIINLPVIHQLTSRFYIKSTQSSTIAWLQGPFKTPDDWINSGRMLMRLWLTMTRHGIYLHPFGSIITNETSHARLRNKFGLDERKNTMWLIMRLGYSDEPPRSLRLNMQDILLK